MVSKWMSALAAAIIVCAGCGGSTSSTSADGGSTSGVTADQACTATAMAQCTRRAECSQNNYLITRTYGDMATCIARLHDTCMAALASNGTGNSPANVMACANAYPSISCTDYLNSSITTGPCAVQPGTLANGAACRFSAQCQSAFCGIPTGTSCGQCAAQPTVGAACHGPNGLSNCGGRGLACVGADVTATPPTAGTCQAYVTMVGATCDTMHLCGSGLSCTPVSTTATNRTCQPAGTLGTACNGASHPACDFNQGFACNGTTHLCAPINVVAAGMPCGTGTDGTYADCLGNGFCMGATSADNHGTCAAASADTAVCNRAVGPSCGAASTCVSGNGSTVVGVCSFPQANACH